MDLLEKIKDIYKYFSKQQNLTIKNVDYKLLPTKIFEETKPIFILSTGRCGTKLLSKLFLAVNAGEVYHDPNPKLTYASRYIYENIEENTKFRKSAFISGRFELLKDCYLRNGRYIETNHHISFFTDAIDELFPKCKFIHLVRHPGDFVRSGIRRNYYKNHDYDDGRIVPSNIAREVWESYSQIQKVGWLWNETNQLIENWKENINSEKMITVKSEDLFTNPSEFEKICYFCDLNKMEIDKINKLIKSPINVQKKGSFPPYDQWTSHQKKELYTIAPLGEKYGFWSGS